LERRQAGYNWEGVAMIQRPTAAGLILCQQAIIEEKTRNITLINSFDWLRFRQFPSSKQFMGYLALTDGLGEMTLSLTVAGLHDLKGIYERSWHETFGDPLREKRRLILVSSCSFPSPGRYQVSILAEGEWVAQCLLTVLAEEE
jgi:hypothetical protein